ncbi:hypothetical protein EDD22DRAFT_956702 [Suillus occidentalis]|nr:hypothetical protein EDD22DRAFT_956702 [Suillus occidentalis]
MVGQALQLEAADPKHINIAVEMAHALSHVFSVYALQTTAVPPMVLSAAAELQEHLDSSFCKVVSTPVWTNIRPNDPRNKISPLYPKSVGYDQPPPPSPAAATTTPAAGPSTKAKGKQRAVPEEDSEDERGRQRGRAKRPRAMSVVAAPKSKHQRAKSKSKAIITSDDDMELDNVVPAAAPQRAPAPAKPLKGILKSTPLFVPNPVSRPGPHYVEIDELEEDTIYSPPQRLPRRLPAPASGLQEDDFVVTSSLVWLPACGPCAKWQLVCHQGYNATNDPLAVCARCHRAKHKCGGKGSIASNKGRRPAANHTRSKSRRRTSTANLTVVTDDEAAAEEAPAEAVTAATATATVPTAATDVPAAATPVPADAAATAAATHDHSESQIVLALKEEMAVLQAMVASLADRVSTGEQLLQESNRRLAEQEANAKLLAGQVAALQQEANSAAESTAADALPVVIRTDATQTPTAAAAQPEEETPAAATATQEEQEQLPCVATAPEQAAAQQDEIPAVTAMQVDESPVNGEESNEAAPQEIGAAVEQESASIASTAHD